MAIMLFWSWAQVRSALIRDLRFCTHVINLQGLEDAFDGNHRSDLQSVIVREHMEKTEDDHIVPDAAYSYGEEDVVSESETYYVCEDPVISQLLPSKESSSLLQLARLSTCAIFHRLTSGKGVPHSFSGWSQ